MPIFLCSSDSATLSTFEFSHNDSYVIVGFTTCDPRHMYIVSDQFEGSLDPAEFCRTTAERIVSMAVTFLHLKFSKKELPEGDQEPVAVFMLNDLQETIEFHLGVLLQEFLSNPPRDSPSRKCTSGRATLHLFTFG